MPKLLVLSDFDRTLFDTARFFDGIWEFAAAKYGLDAEQERQRAREFYDHYGDMYDYRFFDHIADAAGAAYDKDGFIRAAQADLSGKYVYPDVTDQVISLIDAIVTFGNRDYQTFKISLCPRLEAIERHIILEPKGDYIGRTFTEPSVLIDDKRLENEIRPPARFVRIDRDAKERNDDGSVIRDFSELAALVGQLQLD